VYAGDGSESAVRHPDFVIPGTSGFCKSVAERNRARAVIRFCNECAISCAALLGVGLGAYETAYPIYTRENGEQGITAEAHNDYLQILADAGVVGAALALWFLITIFRAIARGVRSPDPLVAAIALGGGAGLFGLLVHSLFDFNLHLPSHALVFLIQSTVISYLGAVAEEHASSTSNLEPSPSLRISFMRRRYEVQREFQENDHSDSHKSQPGRLVAGWSTDFDNPVRELDQRARSRRAATGRGKRPGV